MKFYRKTIARLPVSILGENEIFFYISYIIMKGE